MTAKEIPYSQKIWTTKRSKQHRNGPFDKPFFLRLNIAIGGNYIDGPNGKSSKAYNVVAEEPSTFPATMSVDYVRVYQKREPKEVELKDTELRKLLNEKLGEKLGTTRTKNQKITDVELEKLTDLNLDNSNITNLTGIEAAKNLKNLSLNHNSISNLSPLAGLTSLKTLSLKENKITDISPLTGLTSLTSLNLEDQQPSIKPTDKSFASPLKGSCRKYCRYK
ncbi:leucine-rich repeat domain-containing protein [Candidatus Minimicrobia naudis]|uniref:Leucine-rich repeat domain-containing protein n=1 Tax=Candidatus Minimicrobia naudis TaxID=2841263 RepID=A0A8F1MCG4_9BACT|nr:leucine-rich repeat domain-containing protein [Candidatus Minimicrobia naudis]